MKGQYLAIFVLFAIVGACRSAPPSYSGAQARVYHTVKRHQTLWRICKTYGVNIDHVARVNHIRDPSKIRVGQKIFIPGAKRVLKVDIYIDDIGGRRGRSEDPKRIVLARGRFIWPVRGEVTREFGIRGTIKHDGIDISAPVGTRIRAADSGRVVYSDNKMRGYGNLIIIEHRDNFFTIYAHNKVNLVKEEVLVKQGDIIAQVGKTGNTTGPHLHFEIRKGSKPLDPMRFLP